MTAQARRGAKAIDPESRDMAEALARQAGVSLADWIAALSQSDDLQDAQMLESLSPGDPDMAKEERLTAPDHPADEIGRMARALERLSERLEAGETRSALAVGGIDKLVREALARLEGGEREQTAVAARFEDAVHEVSVEQARLGERLARIEAEARGPRSAEALRSLEAALGKVAGHLYRGETQTQQTIEALRAKLEALEVEGADPSLMSQAAAAIRGMEGRLEALAGEIADQA
ncbi:MAG: Localization factor PodJS, partial [Caulobacteraceae bacterium]